MAKNMNTPGIKYSRIHQRSGLASRGPTSQASMRTQSQPQNAFRSWQRDSSARTLELQSLVGREENRSHCYPGGHTLREMRHAVAGARREAGEEPLNNRFIVLCCRQVCTVERLGSH